MADKTLVSTTDSVPDTDATRRNEMEALRLALRVVPEPVLIVDTARGHITEANPAACKLLGLPRDEVLSAGIDPIVRQIGAAELLSRSCVSAKPADASRVATCGAPAGEATLEWRMATSPNLEQGVYVLIGLQPNLEWPRPAAFAQSTTTPEHRVDPLTGLPDRSTFEKCLAARCAPASDKWGPQFAVLFLDLDGFKEVNDRLGHRRGDAVLRCLAQRLAQAVRPSDLVARFGGDEFTVLLDNVHSVADAASVAQRLLATIEGAAVTGSSGGRISMSIGIALGRPGMPPDALIDAADRAMYQVKAVGGSGWALAEANGPA